MISYKFSKKINTATSTARVEFTNDATLADRLVSILKRALTIWIDKN